MSTSSPNIGTKSRVLRHLMSHKGESVHVTDIVEILGADDKAVRNSLGALARERNTGVDLVRAGVYRYVEPKVESKTTVNGSGRLFEEIGTDRQGRIMIQDEEGNFYLATAIGTKS